MTKINIKLETLKEIENFINIAKKYDFDIDFISGKYVIDGKSLMGILSLDLSKPVEIHIHSDNAQKFIYEIKEYCN